jgi:hypothetical protein
MAKRPQTADDCVASSAPVEDALPAAEYLERIAAAMAACEAMGDVVLARHAGRKLMAAVAAGAEVLLADGGNTLHVAPDKVGAFFDKAAAGLVQAIDAMHKRAALTEAARETDAMTPARPRPADPLAGAIAAWASPIFPPPRSG